MLEAAVIVCFSFAGVAFAAVLGSWRQNGLKKTHSKDSEIRPRSYLGESAFQTDDKEDYNTKVGKAVIRASSIFCLSWACLMLAGVVLELDENLRANGSIADIDSALTFAGITALPASFFGTRLWGQQGFPAFLLFVACVQALAVLRYVFFSKPVTVSVFAACAWTLLAITAIFLRHKFLNRQ